jgi:hypothetical protein
MSRPGRAIPFTNPARWWVTAFALLAFFLQSLTLQSHFHPLVQPVKVAAAHAPASAPVRNQEPVDQCRLCQELMHSGVFVVPAVSSALASLALTITVFIALPSALVSLTRAFAWQSRAPPVR